MADKAAEKDKDKSKVHKLSLKGSAKLVAEFVRHPDLGTPTANSYPASRR